MTMQVPVIFDGGLQRRLSAGDLFATFEPIPGATDTTNTTLAVTAAMLLTPIYVRNPAGVSTDTYPTADALITALQTNYGLSGIPVGLSFRWRVINLSANLITGAVTANTGATMTRGNILASTTKEFQVSITNGTPTVVATAISSTNGSAVLTGFTNAQLTAMAVGQVMITNTANMQGQTIIGINFGAGSVTLSGNANATQAQTMTFSPSYTITGLAA
jgi:hypothetical protein